jgi:hypothetical protein
MPHWYTDGVDDPTGTRVELFPEETIGSSSGSLIPFNVSFDEQSVPNNWLGDPIPSSSAAGDTDLLKLIREVAQQARAYNAALYSLRRYHYAEKFWKPGQPMPSQFPKPNPNGPVEPASFPAPGTDDFIAWAAVAEARFTTASKDLDTMIRAGGHGLDAIADMIQVNGYIVSMRVVANPKRSNVDGRMGALEISGSSSHVSISSPFKYP